MAAVKFGIRVLPPVPKDAKLAPACQRPPAVSGSLPPVPKDAKPAPAGQRPPAVSRSLPQVPPKPLPRSNPPAGAPTASIRPVPKPRTTVQPAGRPLAQPGSVPLPEPSTSPREPPIKDFRVPHIPNLPYLPEPPSSPREPSIKGFHVPKRVLIPNLPYLPDIHFSSAKVIPLSRENFKSYTNSMGKVIVLFFNSEECDNPPLNKQFSLAAERSASRFAYVDCFRNPKLCKRQGACSTPILKLYQDGKFQTCVNKPAKFTAAQIQMVLSAGPAAH